MASKKEFVLDVVGQIAENPRVVLAGHRINSAVLQTIIARPDVQSKLATVLYSLKSASKGANGLKRAANFKITGYKNFPEFNAQAREDVEEFVGGLPAEDAATFNNAENILTILMLPATQAPTGDETLEDSIVSGQSVALTFDSAVRKEYRINGGIYLTVMIGNSAIRPAEEKIALRKEKQNKVKQVRRTPDKIKRELKAKAAKKLNAIDAKRKQLQASAFQTEKELEQLAGLGAGIGAKADSARSIIGKLGAANTASEKAKALIASLTPEQTKTFKTAMHYKRTGKNSLARALAKEIGIPEMVDIVMGGAPLAGNQIIKSKKQALKDAINAATARNEELVGKLSTTSDKGKILSIKSMISKNNAKIAELRVKLGTYKNMSPTALINKAKILKETNAAIEALIAQGATITQALNSAIAKLDAKPEQKQIIKQQVMQQVASGMPAQFAVQQALQENIIEAPQMTSELSGNSKIEDIVANLL